MYEAAAGMISFAALACVIWRPRGMHVAISATVGALLVMAFAFPGGAMFAKTGGSLSSP